jgi:tetratricopeptide (TPR) repeat protein
MSTTLNLVDRLLTLARHRQALGRTQDAIALLTRLTQFRELPADAAEEAQARLGELHLEGGRFRRARRHLTAALRHCPDSARYHFLLARAVSADDRRDPERAAAHYRRSLELSPDQPECLCAGGHLALQQGRREEGLDYLRKALAAAPDDPATVAEVVKGLRRARRVEEARSGLRAALFRNPCDGRFRRLWDDFQFQELRREQETARLRRGADGDDGPVLLPFVRPVSAAEPAPSGGRVIRIDRPQPLPPPRGAGSQRVPPRRHAQ